MDPGALGGRAPDGRGVASTDLRPEQRRVLLRTRGLGRGRAPPGSGVGTTDRGGVPLTRRRGRGLQALVAWAIVTTPATGWSDSGVARVEHEPIPPGDPIYKLENVLISPHCADHTKDWLNDAMRFFIQQYDRFRTGQPLENIVEKHLGY